MSQDNSKAAELRRQIETIRKEAFTVLRRLQAARELLRQELEVLGNIESATRAANQSELQELEGIQ